VYTTSVTGALLRRPLATSADAVGAARACTLTDLTRILAGARVALQGRAVCLVGTAAAVREERGVCRCD
jgi:hypothetical protein